MEELRVSQFEEGRLRIHLQRCELLQTVGKVQVRIGMVRQPIATAPAPTATGGAVFDANKREDIFPKTLLNLPDRHSSTINDGRIGSPKPAALRQEEAHPDNRHSRNEHPALHRKI